jgi:hypothetical protein
MKEFQIPRGGRKPESGIGWIVGEISGCEHAKGRPLLSAIVVRADSKTKVCLQGHPGGGFFGLDIIPAHLRRSPSTYSNLALTSDEQRFIEEEQERVWNYWKTHDDDGL